MDAMIQAVGRLIREAREDAGLTQAELGDALGISGNTITKIEGGHIVLTLGHLVKLPRILHRPITFFLGLDSPLPPDEEELLLLYRTLPPGLPRDYTLNFLRGWVQQTKDWSEDQPD